MRMTEFYEARALGVAGDIGFEANITELVGGATRWADKGHGKIFHISMRRKLRVLALVSSRGAPI